LILGHNVLTRIARESSKVSKDLDFSLVSNKNLSEILSSSTGVSNLWLASQMWLFWWRHLAHLIFSLHDCYEWNFFCNFPSTRLQSHQQHHAVPEVALTVRSVLLKRKFRLLPLF